MRRRIAWAMAVVAVIAVAALVFLYVVGTPSVQAEPSPVVQNTEEAEAPSSQQAPEPDPSSPLAIQIPGCVCHSDDPVLVKEHESYRMNQCAGCHAGGVPTKPE